MIEELKGKTLKEITITKDDNNDECITFITIDDEVYEMYHERDLSENVYIEDICGDLQNLLHSPILLAEEVSSYGDTTPSWTFYKIANINESVTIRWYGDGSGYYSEKVIFEKLEKELPNNNSF